MYIYNLKTGIIMNIEDIVRNDETVVEVKEKPVTSTVILVAAAVLAYMSVSYANNENVGFAMTFFSIVIAIMGLKGVIWPRKYFKHKITNEKIAKKEYYYDMTDLEAVRKCVNVSNPLHSMSMLESLPQHGATSLRVIVYATKSGNYHKVQIQKYVPYEYIPL